MPERAIGAAAADPECRTEKLPRGFARSGMDGLRIINANRARLAGHRDAVRGRRALEILGDRCGQRTRAVAEAWIADPEAPWSVIGERLGMTKDQAIGLFRRMMHRMPVRHALQEDEQQ